MLKPAVFLFQVLEALRFGDLPPPVLALPLIECWLAHAVLATSLSHRLVLALLAHDVNDLRFTKMALFHGTVGIRWENIPPSPTFHWSTSQSSLQNYVLFSYSLFL